MGATDLREQQMPSTDLHRGRNRAYVAGCLVAAVVAAVGGVALLTGGDDTSEAAPTPPPSPAASSPAPPAVASARPTPEDLAAEAAQTKYREYLQVTDEVANAGYVDLAPFDTVAIDPQNIVLARTAQSYEGITTTGEVKVASLTVQSVELDPPGEYPLVRLLACLDVSGTTAVDTATGQSVVPADFPDRLKSEVVVRNIPPGAFTDGRQPGWYVAEVEQRGEPC
jgi:pyruvate/2-oxoglutarate dehydrogenase complex dihydrolipoamide acyltransferase (E2) component